MSMYKFVKGSRLFMQGKRESTDYDNVHDTFAATSEAMDHRGNGGGGSSRHLQPSPPRRHHRSRDGGNGHAVYDEGDDDELRAVHTSRTMQVDGTTEWERSGRTVRKGGVKTRSTRTVRKVTTVTRGEQSVTSESVMSYSSDSGQRYPQLQHDKRSLKFRVVDEKVLFEKPFLQTKRSNFVL